ncbi:type 1 fimbrial protein, partial [Morganella morganii]|nr:type 1 fimbrial protein [Morganella morganii]
MLKKTLITALVSAAFFSGSASAVTAAGGIITISGSIIDTTCTSNGVHRADFA